MAGDPELQARGKLARRLPSLRDMLPGSFIVRERQCGKPNCRCANGKQLHRQFQLSVLWGGKAQTFHIPADMAEEVKSAVQTRQLFEELAAKICEINLRRMLRRKQSENKR